MSSTSVAVGMWLFDPNCFPPLAFGNCKELASAGWIETLLISEYLGFRMPIVSAPSAPEAPPDDDAVLFSHTYQQIRIVQIQFLRVLWSFLACVDPFGDDVELSHPHIYSPHRFLSRSCHNSPSFLAVRIRFAVSFQLRGGSYCYLLSGRDLFFLRFFRDVSTSPCTAIRSIPCHHPRVVILSDGVCAIDCSVSGIGAGHAF